MNVVILAREKSSRYPGKHLHPINGVPALFGMIKRIQKIGARAILCTGPFADNSGYAEVTTWAGGTVYCEERYPEWDIVSRMVGMADELEIEEWIEQSGDCFFSDLSVVPTLWGLIKDNAYDSVSVQTPYSTVIGDRALTAVKAEKYRKMDKFFDSDDPAREQPGPHFPAELYVHHEHIERGADRTVTPIKTSVDHPLEGAIADLVVRHLGRWPETDADIERVYREITMLNPRTDNSAVGRDEKTVEEKV